MARFKPYNAGQTKLVPVSFERQILPGTFEHAVSRLVDEELDLTVFAAPATAMTRWAPPPATPRSCSR